MKFRIILITLIYIQLFSLSYSQEYEEDENCIQSNRLFITLEHAKTDEEIAWGLMQREYLPQDQGMLFHFKEPKYARMWMFNCLIDLSVAFLDPCGTIQEIRQMKAFPCYMDPSRPVDDLQGLFLYPYNDPITLFFQKNGITSSFPASYALEMDGLWFQENGVRVGDVVDWDEENGSAWVIRSRWL